MADNEFATERDARERDLADACELVTDIVSNRARGHRDSLDGNGDSDLLGAIEDVESNIARWREGVHETETTDG